MLRTAFRLFPLLSLAGLLATAPVMLSAAGPGDRSYVSGGFTLNVGGADCGFLRSMDGGAISAEVINEPAGPTYFVKKHIGQPKYEDVTVQLGFNMAGPVYDWIRQSWAMSYERKDCAITVLDRSFAPKSRREFSRCLITETTIPACDGSSKEPAYITLTFAPELTREVYPSSAKAAADLGKNQQKVWLPSNFRLDIDGLNCAHVNKIDSFTIRQTAVTDEIGDARDYLKEPGKLEFPNLRITFAEADAQTWIDWHKGFVIDGNNDESFEKTGTLVFLSPDLKTQLAKITFHNLGIYKLGPDKSEANADQIKRMVAELYCERMEFDYTNQPATSTGESGSQSTTTSLPAAPGGLRVAGGEVAAKVGTVYKTGDIDFRLDRYGYTEFPKVDLQPGANSRCLTFDITLRNASSKPLDYAQADLKPSLLMSDGTAVQWNGYLLSTQATDSTELGPGAEAKLQVFFEVPKSDTVRATKFRFAIGDGKVHVYELTGAAPARRAVNVSGAGEPRCSS